jgi:hypothetical protein
MVVRHQELVEKARKKAEEARRYRERLNSRPEALAKYLERKRVSSAKANAKRDPEELRAAARERMRLLRSDPRKRGAQAEARRAWRADPANANRVNERNKRTQAKRRARLESDPEYREECNRRQREMIARLRADPQTRAVLNARAAKYLRDRKQRDPEYRDRVTAKNKEWKRSNPEKARDQRRRYRKNPRYRSIQSLRTAVHRAIKEGQKRFCSSKYLGIDLRDAKQYIESMLRPGWTWDNHGKAWHIDHIFPIAKANLSDPVEVIAVSNYRNLQPLSVAENKAKKDKVMVEARLLFEQLKREAAETLAAAPALA